MSAEGSGQATSVGHGSSLMRFNKESTLDLLRCFWSAGCHGSS